MTFRPCFRRTAFGVRWENTMPESAATRLGQVRQLLESTLSEVGEDVSVRPLRPVADDPSRVEVEFEWTHHGGYRTRITGISQVEKLRHPVGSTPYATAMRETEASWESGTNS